MTIYPKDETLDVSSEQPAVRVPGRRRQTTTSIQKFVRVTLGSAAIGVLLSVGGMSFAGQHGNPHGIQHTESAPHRCSGCANGTCQPRTRSFGHYQPHWRRWPVHREYEGIRKPTPQLTPPDVRVPDASNEMRVVDRTRSDRPLDDEEASNAPGGDGLGAGSTDGGDFNVAPNPESTSGPSDPFGNVVPNTDLPDTGGGAFEAGDSFDAGGAGGDGNLFDPVPPNNNAPPTDSDPFGPAGGSSDSLPDADLLFGPTSGLVPPANSAHANVGPIRSIKNRRITRKGKDFPTVKSVSATSVEPRVVEAIPAVTGVQLDVPRIDTVGGSFGNGEFSADDLRLGPKQLPTPEAKPLPNPSSKTTSSAAISKPPKSDLQIAFEQVSYEEPIIDDNGLTPPPLQLAAANGKPAIHLQNAAAAVPVPLSSPVPVPVSGDDKHDGIEMPRKITTTPKSVTNPEEPVEEIVETVSEEVFVLPNGNPLRAKRKIITTTIRKKVKPNNPEKNKELKPMVEAAAEPKLQPVMPSRLRHARAKAARARDAEETAAVDAKSAMASQMKKQQTSIAEADGKLVPQPGKPALLAADTAKPVTTPRIDSTRTLSLNKRSLRNTLRKNPLR